MGLLNNKLTWLQGIAAAVVVLTPPWAWITIEMAGARASVLMARPPQRPAVGWTGACLVAVAPVLALVVGWVLLRRHSGWRWALGAMLAAVGTALLLAHVGTYLIHLGFPVKA